MWNWDTDTTDGQFGKHRFLKPTNDYDPCAGIPISRLLSVFNCDLNVKVLVGALNQENALVGAFSIVDGCETWNFANYANVCLEL